MIITKQQAKFIAELAGQIQEKYGLIIGYSNPALPMPAQRDADFIIFENPDIEDLHCFYKDDIEERPLGPYMVRVLPAEPEHDEKVQDLLERLNNDLMDGKLWFDPTVSKIVDDLEIEVTKKRFPGTSEDVFATNIETSRFGSVYTYAFIREAAHTDRRFRIAKEIIDENWPREDEPDEVHEQAGLREFISRLFKLFGI